MEVLLKQNANSLKYGRIFLNSPINDTFFTSEIGKFFYQFYQEKTMAPLSSILAWKIPWTGEPGGLQSMGLLRVGQD